MILSLWLVCSVAETMAQGGGTIQMIDIGQSDSTVYVASEGGIFKSTDGGGSWSEVSTGLSDRRVQLLTVDPNNSDIAYVSPFKRYLQKPLTAGSFGLTRDSLTATMGRLCSYRSE